jgi:hypothetical protein
MDWLLFSGSEKYSRYAPLVLDPLNLSDLYFGYRDTLLMFPDANNLSFTPDPVKVKLPLLINEGITAIEMAAKPDGIRRYYVCSDQYFADYAINEPDTSAYSGLILRSEDGINWSDITANLTACYKGLLTDIETDCHCQLPQTVKNQGRPGRDHPGMGIHLQE